MTNKLIILSLAILTLFSCSSETSKKPTVDEITFEINALMNQWHKDAADAKLDAYMALMHKSSNYIGTDGTENWTKSEFKAFCKPHFEKKKTWNFKPLERNVYVNQARNTAWFEEILETALGPCRGSGVLEKFENSWKLKQFVLSMTVPNTDSKKVLEVKDFNDSLFLEQLKY